MNKNARIVRLFFAKMKLAFFDLSEVEQQEFMGKDRKNLDELGMESISMIQCTGPNNEWDYIGVESWPSNQALAKREIFEQEVLTLKKFVEYKTMLGVEQSYENYGK